MEKEQETIVAWIARTEIKMTASLIPARTNGVSLDDGQYKVTWFHYQCEFSWPDNKRSFVCEFSSGSGCFGNLPKHITPEQATKHIEGSIFYADLSADEKFKIRKYHEAVKAGPKPDSVLDCLISDASVLDYSFSDWCSEFGLSDDSIKAKASYDFTLEQAHRFRNFVGAHYASLQECEKL